MPRKPRKKLASVALYEAIWPNIERRGPDECWPWRGHFFTEDGYGRLADGTRVARAVYEMRWGKKLPRSIHVRHTCDNPPCCNPGHLVEGTSAQNHEDMVERGRSTRGVKNPFAKLDPTKVAEIRSLSKFRMTAPAIAAKVGVSPRTVLNVLNGDTWSHV